MQYKNILAIDDEDMCLEVISFSLEMLGYNVFTASTAKEGIAFLNDDNIKIDLILLDMMLPDIYGLKALKSIKDIKSAKNIPVVIQTGTSNYDDLKHAIKLGAEPHVIRKPYCRKDLLAVVDIVFGIDKNNSITQESSKSLIKGAVINCVKI